MQSLYDIPAPAKLNLFLHITGRRDDGYHLLQSVFMLIDWCDPLHFEVRRDGQINREHISIHKSIPAQAGMGGGSSDAASTLLALNRLWKLQLPLSALTRLGLALGADVPFFLGGHNAWVEGIGEQITPIQLPPTRVLVVKPDAGLDTRLIFSDPALKRDSETAIISGFAANASRNGLNYGRNDLQSVAQKLCLGLACYRGSKWSNDRLRECSFCASTARCEFGIFRQSRCSAKQISG